MALIGLYSGRQIKKASENRERITRTQTGTQALKAIVKKYGSIQDNSKYHHVGKGVWRKYSIKNDKKRTGKVTTSLDRWAKQPHKLDFRGKDTKESKKTLSVSMIKKPSKPKRRIAKTQKIEHKPTLKKLSKPPCSKVEQERFVRDNPHAKHGDFVNITLPKNTWDLLRIDRSQRVNYSIHPRYKTCDYEIKFIDPVAGIEKRIAIGKTTTNNKLYKAKIKKSIMESFKLAKNKAIESKKLQERKDKEKSLKNAQIIKNAIAQKIIKSINSEADYEFPPNAKVEVRPSYVNVNNKNWHDGFTYDVIVTYQDGLSEPDAIRTILNPILSNFNNHSNTGLRAQYVIKRKMSSKLKKWIVDNYGKGSRYLQPSSFRITNY